MTKADTVTLTKIINKCFDHSMDDRFSDKQRARFLAEGKRLRGHLLNLLTAEFEEDAPELLEANEKLAAVNKQIAKATTALADTADAIRNVANLVGILDRLVGIAAAFV